MVKGRIYWFTGQPAHGKTVLGKKLVELLQTEKRNWRKQVFHLDGDDLRELTINKDYSEQGRINNIRNAQMIAEYLSKNGCDVVVSLVAPYRWLREEFKERIGSDNFQEFYVHTTQKRERDHFKVEDYEEPLERFFDVDTTKDNPEQSFTKIVNYLTENNKL
jgi:adenylylsulfate kinase-like enzyme